MMQIPTRLAATSAFALLLACSSALAQERGVSMTLGGAPGLLTAPAALTSSKDTIAFSFANKGPEMTIGLGFQATEALWFGTRLSRLDDFDGDAFSSRSFDLRYQIFNEEGWRPALAIGFEDALRNGPFSSEYLVATKTVSDAVRVTGGLGWGRLASDGGFDNILGRDERNPYLYGVTGEGVEFSNFFSGEMAVFAGLEYAFHDDFTLKVEYSSDAGPLDAAGQPLLEAESPWSLGLVWRPNARYHLQAGYMQGSEFAFGGTVFFNPHKPFAAPAPNAPPVPVLDRARERPQVLDIAALSEVIAREGLVLEAAAHNGTQMRLRYSNPRFYAEAEALGRLSRILTRHAPSEVETFILEPVSEGVPMSAVLLQRRDLERSANRVGGTEAIAAARELRFAGTSEGLTFVPQQTFEWHIGPAVAFMAVPGSGEAPALGLDVKASAEWRLGAGVVLDGVARWRLASSADDVAPEPYPNVPQVRRDGILYGADGAGVERLTLSHWGRPGQDLYSRLSFGLLEEAYAGVSAELLYKPVAQNWGLGLDLHYVEKRDYDMLFDLQDYNTTVGHATFYYTLSENLEARLSAGKYLAGDWGATLAVDRTFNNGWVVGGYATLTDLDHPDYKDGAFDKGLTLTVPFSYFTGKPTRSAATLDFGAINGDGGSSLEGGRQLYDAIRAGHEMDLSAGWGRFWQ